MGAPGRFISFEGGEGAGKSTNIRLLAQALEMRGITVVSTREPGGSPGAEEIRRLLVEGDAERWDPVCEVLLHYAARRDHVERIVRPALHRGDWVLSDRFADSTMAYQGYGHDLGQADMIRLHGLVLGGFQPDLTIILDIAVEQGLARAGHRESAEGAGEDRYERMDMEFHRRLRDGFLDIARRHPERCAVIDAAQTPEEIHRDILGLVERRLGTVLT